MRVNACAGTRVLLETLCDYLTTTAIFFSAESTIFQATVLILCGVL